MLDHPRYGVWRTKSSEELFQIYVIEVSISMLVSCMQMASKAGKSLLPRSASKPQEEMFSFSPPSRHTDKLPHSSSAAGNVQRERDATAAAQLSQLHFAERMPGASLLHALTECMAGPDGGACEHDSSNSPGDDSTQHTAATRQAATLAASRPSASLPQSANLHQENGHSAATPARGGSVKGSVSEARDRPSARDAVGQQPDLPMSSGSSNTEGRSPCLRPEAGVHGLWVAAGPRLCADSVDDGRCRPRAPCRGVGAPTNGECACATFPMARQAQRARAPTGPTRPLSGTPPWVQRRSSRDHGMISCSKTIE